MNTQVLRGSTRWMLVITGPLFCLFGVLNYLNGEVVFPVLAIVFGLGGLIQALRVRVELGEKLYYVGFFVNHHIDRLQIVAVEPVFKGRSVAPVLTLSSGRRIFLSGLSGGWDAAEASSVAIRNWIRH